MGFFKRDFNKPGPGVPKNAPKKKGFPRFFELLGRDFSSLVKLNLMYQLCLLPSQILLLLAFIGIGTAWFPIFGILGIAAGVLVGPATTACFYILIKMMRDEPGFVGHDFVHQFKSNFKSSAVPGVVFTLIVTAQAFALLYYLGLGGQLNFILVAIFIFSVMIFVMAYPYFFAQAAYLDIKGLPRLQNSIFLALGFAPRNFVGALLGSGLVAAQFAFFPLALILTLFIGYSIPMLLNVMWIWPPLDKTFKIDETLTARRKKEVDELMEESKLG